MLNKLNKFWLYYLSISAKLVRVDAVTKSRIPTPRKSPVKKKGSGQYTVKANASPLEHSYAHHSVTSTRVYPPTTKPRKKLDFKAPPALIHHDYLQSFTEKDRKGMLLQNLIEKIHSLLTSADKSEALVLKDISEKALKMASKKWGFVSCLCQKGYENLVSFSWFDIINELLEQHPSLARILFTLFSIPNSHFEAEKFEAVVPRIGIIYAIIFQYNHLYLSRVQRIISALLLETVCHQKVRKLFLES